MPEDAQDYLSQIRETQAPQVELGAQTTVDGYITSVTNFLKDGDFQQIEDIVQGTPGASREYDEALVPQTFLDLPEGTARQEMGSALTVLMKRIVDEGGIVDRNAKAMPGETLTRIRTPKGEILDIVSTPENPDEIVYVRYNSKADHIDTSAPVTNADTSMQALATAEPDGKTPTVHFYTTGTLQTGISVHQMSFMNHTFPAQGPTTP